MVTDQHKQIKGYRDLTEEEIALMHESKELAKKCRELTERMKGKTFANGRTVDGRWLSIGVTDLQKGFMAIVRSIAQPETF